ncbi:hypothetical protein KDA14_03690 [Candidatus Saccharibacteria bacterium]|nr:hypothetical protein [Candidatus Saccharibacteria bacterium]
MKKEKMSEATTLPHEFGSQPQDVESFVAAIDAVQEYNDQFSLGKMMARALIGNVKQAKKAEELVQEGASFEEAQEVVEFVGEEKPSLRDEQGMLRELVGITNETTFVEAGLALSPLRENYTVHSTEGSFSVGRLRIGISEGNRFSSFLMNVSPQNVSDEMRHSAKKVVTDVIAEAEHSIVEYTDTGRVAEILAYAQGIGQGLDHIGIGDSDEATSLKNLAAYAAQGVAREYVVAKHLQLFEEPGQQGFGPAQWQRDASEEFLNAQWHEVLNAIHDAADNPNGGQLASALIASARKSLDFALNDWQDVRHDAGYGEGYGSGFDAIFETVGLELDMLGSPADEK